MILTRLVLWLGCFQVWMALYVIAQNRISCRDKCDSLMNMCPGDDTVVFIDEVTGESREFDSCPGLDNVEFIDNDAIFQQDNSRYVSMSNSLTITNLQGNDSGLYTCNGGTRFCLGVTSLVSWEDCPNPMNDNRVCRENVHAYEGEDIELNTRMMFSMNPCQCYLDITEYSFFDEEGIIYSCSSSTECTFNPGNRSLGFNLTRKNFSSNPYDFALVLSRASININGSRLLARIVGQRPPSVDGSDAFSKTFDLTVTIQPTTEPATTSSESTTSPTSSEPGDNIAAVVGPVVGSIAAITLLLVIVMVPIILLLYRHFTRHQSGRYKNSRSATNQEQIYAEILDNGADNKLSRNSAYYSSGTGPRTAGVDLSPTLESMSISA